jgi:hypothetical protein
MRGVTLMDLAVLCDYCSPTSVIRCGGTKDARAWTERRHPCDDSQLLAAVIEGFGAVVV